MTELYCGIDIGTTNLKVLLLDDEGQTIWVKSVPAPHLHDGIGIVTDATALVACAEQLIIEGCSAVARGRKLAAISSAGIGEDGVAVDAKLKPLGHAIQWNDRRGETYATALGKTDVAKAHPAILFDFSSTAGKWLWLRQNRPAELHGAKHWLTMTDFMLAQWSDTAFMSATLAPRTSCYDVFTRQWLDGLLDVCHAPPLPPQREAGQIVGTLKNGPLRAAGVADHNTILVAGGHDHPIAASAIRRIDTNARIDSMGTANATYGETKLLNASDDLQGLYVTLPVSAGVGTAVIGMTEFSVTLGKYVDDVAALHQRLLIETALPQNIVAPLTALAERTRHYWQAMTEVGVPSAPIFATGGWARCPAIMQLRADIFAEPVTVVDEPELVALGAALFAAQACGKNIEFSASKRSHVVDPD